MKNFKLLLLLWHIVDLLHAIYLNDKRSPFFLSSSHDFIDEQSKALWLKKIC
jgi:hypothetical protein